MLEEVGLISRLLPEADHFAICDRTSNVLTTRLAALFFAAGEKKTEARLKELKFSKNVSSIVQRLVSHSAIEPESIVDSADVRRFVSHVGEDIVDELLDLMRARELTKCHELIRKVKEERNSGCPFTVGELAIGGADVMEALKTPGGPRVGAILQDILERVIEDPELNERDKLLELLSSMTAGEKKC